MAREPEAIEAEIEKTRQKLASTLDELSVRANPQRVVEQAKSGALSVWENPKVKYAVFGVAGVLGLALVRKLFR